jgi:hypothetical protein
MARTPSRKRIRPLKPGAVISFVAGIIKSGQKDAFVKWYEDNNIEIRISVRHAEMLSIFGRENDAVTFGPIFHEKIKARESCETDDECMK